MASRMETNAAVTSAAFVDRSAKMIAAIVAASWRSRSLFSFVNPSAVWISRTLWSTKRRVRASVRLAKRYFAVRDEAVPSSASVQTRAIDTRSERQ